LKYCPTCGEYFETKFKQCIECGDRLLHYPGLLSYENPILPNTEEYIGNDYIDMSWLSTTSSPDNYVTIGGDWTGASSY